MAAAPTEIPILDKIDTPDPEQIRDRNPYRKLAQLIADADPNDPSVAGLVAAYDTVVRPVLGGPLTRAVTKVKSDLAASDAFWSMNPIDRVKLLPFGPKRGTRFTLMIGETLLEAQRSAENPDTNGIWTSREFGALVGLTHGRVHQMLTQARVWRGELPAA